MPDTRQDAILGMAWHDGGFQSNCLLGKSKNRRSFQFLVTALLRCSEMIPRARARDLTEVKLPKEEGWQPEVTSPRSPWLENDQSGSFAIDSRFDC